MGPQVQRSRRLPRDFRVGDWLVQPSLDRISCAGRTAHLRPKLMDVLVHLAEHAGEVLPKDDIIAAVWEQKFLAESVLTRSITELRHALGDDLETPRYIETITKRGYRLLAPVAELDEPRPAVAGRAAFVVSHAGRRVALAEGESMIGRAPDAALRVDSMAVSRHHARVVVAGDRARLEDLGSKNGTLVDGRVVSRSADLFDGTRIQVGPALLVVHVIGLMGSTETDPRREAAADEPGPSKDTG
jgi:DNA-binding winged helix-turn-helix (wHTH) protein